ncbi:MAG: hypothetical protein QOJ64_3835 [Acidobacteriota bacterium]|jgi:hypothetical protein|nr:hypothetical protein [Acidobacteriota bacterium]
MAKGIKKKTEAVVDEAAYSPGMERLARFGYGTKGLVYIVVGALSAQVAIGWGGRTADTNGAFREIETQPLGKAALATVAFGLIGYVLWRWIQALADTAHKGTKLKGVLIRIGYFFSGAVYAGLAYTAAKALIDIEEPRSSSDAQEHWIARVLTMPFGRALIIGAGACVIGFGLYQIYKGLAAKFRKGLKLYEMNKTEDAWATWSGRIGYSARGVVFCIMGFFVIQAAVNYRPHEAKGVDEVLGTLAQISYGAWLLGAVAAGLIAFGFYMIIEARYRRIAGS